MALRFIFSVSTEPVDDEWANARREILIAPESLRELDVRSAPHYVLLDGERSCVLTEGVPFSSAQIAEELASFLTS